MYVDVGCKAVLVLLYDTNEWYTVILFDKMGGHKLLLLGLKN